MRRVVPQPDRAPLALEAELADRPCREAEVAALPPGPPSSARRARAGRGRGRTARRRRPAASARAITRSARAPPGRRLAARRAVAPDVPARPLARGSPRWCGPRSRRSRTRAGPRRSARAAEPGEPRGLAGARQRALSTSAKSKPASRSRSSPPRPAVLGQRESVREVCCPYALHSVSPWRTRTTVGLSRWEGRQRRAVRKGPTPLVRETLIGVRPLYLPRHGRRDRRGRDVRRLAGVVARAARRRASCWSTSSSRATARDVGRRDAADPLRARRRRRLHRDGAPRAHALARARGRDRRGADDRVRHGLVRPPRGRLGGRRRCARWPTQGIPVERLDLADAARLFPSLGGDDLAWVLYEPEAGVLRAQRAVRALAAQARGARRAAGARPRDAGRATRRARRRRAARGRRASCGRAAAGSRGLFGELVALRVTLPGAVFLDGGPAWAQPGVPGWVDYDRAMYGTADLDELGVKVALDIEGPPLDPDARAARRRPRPSGVRALRRRALPRARGRAAQRGPQPAATSSRPTRTSSPPASRARPATWLVGGGSGHGFKHGPAMAERVAAALHGERAAPGALRRSAAASAGRSLRTAGSGA